MPIFTCDAINLQELTNFERIHNEHMVQTINYNEIPTNYIFIKGKNARERTLTQIQKMLEV